MDRLTERDEYGNADIIGVDSADIQLNLDYDGFNKVTDALNRLAAYEDTGLDPEEIKRSDALLRVFIDLSRRHARTLPWMEKVMIADREGRLLVLPCKVGDTVYTLGYKPCHYGETHPDSYGCEGCHDQCDIERAVHAIQVRDIRWILLNAWEIMSGKYFMSREEAEAALGGGKQ